VPEPARSLAQNLSDFRHGDEMEVAIFTGAGRALSAGENMQESLANGAPSGRCPTIKRLFQVTGIATVNGFAMRGFMLVERTDLRVAVRGAVFKIS
jgi:hypothetical protein